MLLKILLLTLSKNEIKEGWFTFTFMVSLSFKINSVINVLKLKKGEVFFKLTPFF